MALFDSEFAPPVSVQPSAPSNPKKRKRKDVQIEQAQVNVEKLLKSLPKSALAAPKQASSKPKKPKNTSTKPDPPKPAAAASDAPAKKKQKHKPIPSPFKNQPPAPKDPSLTSMQQKMKDKLGGARFRWINEQLYTTSGEEAAKLMDDTPSIFTEYHSGFRHQSSSWPVQPVQLFIDSLSSLPARSMVVDLGAGDAFLAKSLTPKNLKVVSFDLAQDQEGWVQKAQCSSCVPLPGPHGAIADVVVCCLSLMGSDWAGMIKEAHRILKPNGKLKIAEVTSRFEDQTFEAFTQLVSAIGFSLTSKDTSNTHFVIFEFTKATKGKKDAERDFLKDGSKILKPCLYKRR